MKEILRKSWQIISTTWTILCMVCHLMLIILLIIFLFTKPDACKCDQPTKAATLQPTQNGAPEFQSGQAPFFMRLSMPDITAAEQPVSEEALLNQPSFYPLTDEERDLLHKAVMAEARGESYEGQMMIAQAILDGAERNGFDIAATINQYKISTIDMAPNDSVVNAVSAVFDHGERVTEEKADLWYAPALVTSRWHESQQYIITIGSHKFFWCNNDLA